MRACDDAATGRPRFRCRTATLLLIALLGGLLIVMPRARAQGDEVVINEIVAANTTTTDDFGATSDWLELRNTDSVTIDLNGWTVSDDQNSWTLPPVSLGAGDRLLIWASDRNLAGPPLHTNFRLSASGETVRLARPDGSLADTLTYPSLADDQAYGRSPGGGLGYLQSATPGTPNANLTASAVSLDTTPRAFTGSLPVALSAPLRAGESIRYTTNGAAVTAASPTYSAPIVLTNSTVLRAAVVGPAGVGPEVTGGFLAVSADLANRTSDLPIVLVHSVAAVGYSDQQAIVAVIDREGNGQARILGDADYTGFAGLRIRGSSSSSFPKKQYKFELWESPDGTSRNGSLLGLGTDDDWGLYAPGRYDRAMINNPFMYELAHRVGVPAPDIQFVELWLEDDQTNVIGNGDYRGLYALRETIEVDPERVDIVEHTPSSAGPDGGYILRSDRKGTCCTTIRDINSVVGNTIDSPTPQNITPAQVSWVDAWFDQMLAAAASRNFAQIEQYFEVDDIIDYWLLQMVSGEPDVLVLSTFLHKDAGTGLSGGPMWDYDRGMGSIDARADGLDDAQSWRNLQSFDFWGDLWAVPEIQARLRARWAELRTTHLSDAAITTLTNDLRDEIATTYPLELTVWNGNGYGPRFGNGLDGEIANLQTWMQVRLDWLDGQLSSASLPTVSNPGTILLTEGQPLSYQFTVNGGSAFAFDVTDLPAGITLDDNGLLSGTVALGDAVTSPVTVTVTNELGGQQSTTFTIDVTPSFTGPAPIVLNEYNAVLPGGLLDANGDDVSFGRIAGNGGDWFELVTIDDHLDLRGWRFDIHTNASGVGVVQTASLRLSNDDLLADIRAGTIITVSESVPDDLSYDPRNGDWTINLQSNNAQQGALWSNQTNFDTNNTKWRLVIRDAALAVRAPIAGETEPWDDVNFGVSDAEVMHLGVDPTATPDLLADYADTTESSFGEPNRLAGRVQDLSALRPAIRDAGNVSCDGVTNIVDALLIAQFTVGNRSGASCPLPVPNQQLNLSDGDINDSGAVDIVDALIISQCTVGIDLQDLCTPE